MKKYFSYIKSSPLPILFVLVLVLFSCTGRPSNVLAPDKMEQVLYEYHLAKALADQNKYEQRYRTPLYIQDVLDKNGVTLAEFDSSMVWYSRRLPELSEMYKSVSTRLEGEKTVLDSLVIKRFETKITTLPGDTVDIWSWKRAYRFTGAPLNNYFYYSLQADDNFKKGDTFQFYLSAKYLNLTKDSIDVAYHGTAGLVLTFGDGKRLVETLPILNDTVLSLTLKGDSLATLVGLNGYFYYPAQTDNRILFIDSVALQRMSLVNEFSLKTDSLEVDSLLSPSSTKGLEVQMSEAVE